MMTNVSGPIAATREMPRGAGPVAAPNGAAAGLPASLPAAAGAASSAASNDVHWQSSGVHRDGSAV
jgi:hypothetical protein